MRQPAIKQRLETRVFAQCLEAKRDVLLKFDKMTLQEFARCRIRSRFERLPQARTLVKHCNLRWSRTRILEYFHGHSKRWWRSLPARVFRQRLTVALRSAEFARVGRFLNSARNFFIKRAHSIPPVLSDMDGASEDTLIGSRH